MILQRIVDLMEMGLNATGKTFTDIKICELGDQRMKWHPAGTGKRWCLQQGASEHVSIDLNGKHGALRIDLSKPVDKWKNYFDMTTNYGTAEHVDGGIYECYHNIHNFTKANSPMIHAGPIAGGCPWHSPYHYKPTFFKEIARINGYKLILEEERVVPGRKKNQKPIDRTLLCAVLIKINDKPFMNKKEFVSMNLIEGLD